jgi:predicted nucleic acid-binding Zn ribbon protein
MSAKSVGQALTELTQTLGIQNKLQQYEAVTQWAAIVGARIAAQTEAVRIENGVLVVRVKTAVWRNELNMRKQEILEKLNKTIQHEVVKDIRFQ